MSRLWKIMLLVLLLCNAALLASHVYAIDYDDEPVWVVRDLGSVFGTRKHDDPELRWRVMAGSGTLMWGNGQEPFAAFAPQIGVDGRILYEFDTSGNYHGHPVGIVLNQRNAGALSLTSENGALVIRDERRGVNHIMAIITADGIQFPQVE